MEDFNYKTKELYSDDIGSGFMEKIIKKGKRAFAAAAMVPVILLPSYSHAAAHAVVAFKGSAMAVAAASSSQTPDKVTISWYNAAGCNDFSVYRKRLDDDDWNLLSSYSNNMIVDNVQLNTDYEYKIVPNQRDNECPVYIFELKAKDDGKFDIKWKTEPPKNLKLIIE